VQELRGEREKKEAETAVKLATVYIRRGGLCDFPPGFGGIVYSMTFKGLGPVRRHICVLFELT
jgi:hypothetical protein